MKLPECGIRRLLLAGDVTEGPNLPYSTVSCDGIQCCIDLGIDDRRQGLRNCPGCRYIGIHVYSK
jgi:hypothetical protein